MEAMPEEKKKANIELIKAVRNGTIKRPSECSRCGSYGRTVHGHHEDYSKPLDVVWLCGSCHQKYHKGVYKLESIDILLSKTMGDRIRIMRNWKKMSVVDIADIHGVSRQTWYSWELNKAKPSIKHMKKMVHIEDIDLHWLIMGAGDE